MPFGALCDRTRALRALIWAAGARRGTHTTCRPRSRNAVRRDGPSGTRWLPAFTRFRAGTPIAVLPYLPSGVITIHEP
jgi:hypothetical protein